MRETEGEEPLGEEIQRESVPWKRWKITHVIDGNLRRSLWIWKTRQLSRNWGRIVTAEEGYPPRGSRKGRVLKMSKRWKRRRGHTLREGGR